jgi:serine/threonine protein kinase
LYSFQSTCLMKVKVNILITDSHRACLADFGLATTKDSKSFVVKSATTMRVTGTLRWQAPELFDPYADDTTCVSSLASDVYAFACVCYEVAYMIIPKHHNRFSLPDRYILVKCLSMTSAMTTES